MKLPGYTPLALAMLLYLWQAVEYAVRREYAMAGVFIGYALANAAFVWDFMRRTVE